MLEMSWKCPEKPEKNMVLVPEYLSDGTFQPLFKGENVTMNQTDRR